MAQPVHLFNTLTRQKEALQPLHESEVRIYSCGVTVYDYPHIGNLRAYLFVDILKGVLKTVNYSVLHGMNVTDVGHLVGDGDEGEDKLEVGAKREGVDPLAIAKKYEAAFWEDYDALQMERPQKVLAATQAIPEQIALIQKLEEHGYTYQTEQAIYFDTSKVDDYGKLTGQKLADKLTAARDEVVTDSNKKNPADFALWFFLVGRYESHILKWVSPWGEGFPGWHIECSAIARELLGQPLDIHTGGVDHIGTHHTNEIAQSEAAYHEPLANIWMHNEHLSVEGKRMGKSEGNLIRLVDLAEKGCEPLDYRYLTLTAHYRSKLNFTWDALQSARKTRLSIQALVAQDTNTEYDEALYNQVLTALADDLNTAEALALLHRANSGALWTAFEPILKIGIVTKSVAHDIPQAVLDLFEERNQARINKDWEASDTLRDALLGHGYRVQDSSDRSDLKPI